MSAVCYVAAVVIFVLAALTSGVLGIGSADLAALGLAAFALGHVAG